MTSHRDPLTGFVVAMVVTTIILIPVFGPWVVLGTAGALYGAKKCRDLLGH